MLIYHGKNGQGPRVYQGLWYMRTPGKGSTCLNAYKKLLGFSKGSSNLKKCCGLRSQHPKCPVH